MLQTLLTVVVEIQPSSADVLRDRIRKFHDQQEATTPQYRDVIARMPSLHFLSMTIFDDAAFDPVLVLEANFDGPAGPFWAQLEASYGDHLREVLRCGKPPRNRTKALFAAVTRPGSNLPIAPLLEALTILPAVGHQGNHGLDRTRVIEEGALFAAVEGELDDPRYRTLAAPAIHAELRRAMLPRFAWLDQPESPRAPPNAGPEDLAVAVAAVVLALLVISAPGIVLALLLPGWLVLAVAVAAAVVAIQWLRRAEDPTGASPIAGAIDIHVVIRLLAGLAILVGVEAGVWALLAAPFGGRASDHFAAAARALALGLAGAVPVVLLLLARLRYEEMRDPVQDAPPPDPARRAALGRSEDQVVQNHMASLVHIKPGILRAILLKVGFTALGLLLRMRSSSRAGYLGSMRTIHFAHWGVIGGGTRLLFVSNFDGTWESYLDDFIEKATVGLTLAWTGCVGFPSTRFLIFDGASQGRKFKDWARHSMAEHLFWFSAYPDFTVNQIERQARIASGLRRPTLGTKEASEWTKCL